MVLSSAVTESDTVQDLNCVRAVNVPALVPANIAVNCATVCPSSSSSMMTTTTATATAGGGAGGASSGVDINTSHTQSAAHTASTATPSSSSSGGNNNASTSASVKVVNVVNGPITQPVGLSKNVRKKENARKKIESAILADPSMAARLAKEKAEMMQKAAIDNHNKQIMKYGPAARTGNDAAASTANSNSQQKAAQDIGKNKNSKYIPPAARTEVRTEVKSVGYNHNAAPGPARRVSGSSSPFDKYTNHSQPHVQPQQYNTNVSTYVPYMASQSSALSSYTQSVPQVTTAPWQTNSLPLTQTQTPQLSYVDQRVMQGQGQGRSISSPYMAVPQQYDSYIANIPTQYPSTSLAPSHSYQSVNVSTATTSPYQQYQEQYGQHTGTQQNSILQQQQQYVSPALSSSGNNNYTLPQEQSLYTLPQDSYTLPQEQSLYQQQLQQQQQAAIQVPYQYHISPTHAVSSSQPVSTQGSYGSSSQPVSTQGSYGQGQAYSYVPSYQGATNVQSGVSSYQSNSTLPSVSYAYGSR